MLISDLLVNGRVLNLTWGSKLNICMLLYYVNILLFQFACISPFIPSVWFICLFLCEKPLSEHKLILRYGFEGQKVLQQQTKVSLAWVKIPIAFVIPDRNILQRMIQTYRQYTALI